MIFGKKRSTFTEERREKFPSLDWIKLERSPNKAI